ncbi:hypothetical protein SCP_0903090 [Sparassis crispa]|uniref:Uncharacterized protein n=1 Tax=Sparassis crispa TaxID=139825 RepID=A0A401GW58_9APHY|nr:hypothetical protein SCP_0903090 [Sparassis crispa]GBE86430.1 hypothetical protein SCP_0903090 [Sparassis crispa]
MRLNSPSLSPPPSPMHRTPSTSNPSTRSSTEDDTHNSSRGIAWAYFSQASTTFTEMDEDCCSSVKDL